MHEKTPSPPGALRHRRFDLIRLPGSVCPRRFMHESDVRPLFWPSGFSDGRIGIRSSALSRLRWISFCVADRVFRTVDTGRSQIVPESERHIGHRKGGPLTRSTIKQKSCATAYIPIAPANDQTASVGASISSDPAITLPAAGSQLTIGKTYAVAWNQAPSYMYSLILQSQSGSGEGYILKDQTSSTQYAWQAGRVYSSALSDYTNVATGTYRVRLIQPSKGMSASDPVSGWFTLASAPLSIASMSPGSAQNNNRTSVVLYGSGFTTSSTVRFDGIYGPYASILYVSPDGTVIVFSVPSGISPGIHPVMVVDPSGSTSNVQSLSVIAGSN